MTDPNVTTTPEGEEVILEPGDPGYVDPEEAERQAADAAAAVPGADLQHVRQPGETDAEFAARTRNVVVESQSPTDIVPNTPQISMGARVPVEGQEGVSYATAPVEAGPSVAEPEEEEAKAAPAEEEDPDA